MGILKATTVLLLYVSISNALFAQDWANLKRYKDDNEKMGLPKAGEKRVVFMGNSIIEGWSNSMPDYFSDNGYINRGIS